MRIVLLVFVLVAAGIVLNSFVAYTAQSLAGTAILLAAAVAYFVVFQSRATA